MFRKSLIHGIALLFGLAVCWSCIPQDQPRGTGSVSLVLKTSHTVSATRATEPGLGTAADGGQIANNATYGTPDLMVFIVNSDEPPTVSARYYPGCDPGDPDKGAIKAHYTATADTLTFSSLTEGDYTVYAFANTEGLSLSAAFDPATVSSQATLDGLLFEALTSPDTIILSNSRMPLAATTSLHVYEGANGMATLEMQRCLSRISVELINQTQEVLTMPNQLGGEDGLSVVLKHMNPNQGYVFAHDPDIPSGAYTPGPCGDVEFTCAPTIPATGNPGDTLRLTRLVFPSDTLRCGAYTCDVDFYLGTTLYSYHDLHIVDNRARLLAVLARNTHLHIEIRISRYKRVSFNFSVEDWDDSKIENITFN